MDHERFAERVREELGEEINPLYVEEILKKNIPDLLHWLQSQLEDTVPTVQETLLHSERYKNHKNERGPSVLLLGIRILNERFKFILFVLKEIKSRIEASDV